MLVDTNGNMHDPYYDREEVSNSDLSEIGKYWMDQELIYDLEKAYRFGTLLDMMITEAWKVNYFKLTCAGVKYTKEEFVLAEEMKKSFWEDEFCAYLASYSEMQKITVRNDFPIDYEGFRFYMNVRIKWDLYALGTLNITGDIKSTTAETLKQFIAACHHFQYFRQRSWYMDIGDSNNDMLIGISKVNKKVFKVPIRRGDEFYKIGRAQYQELAFKYFYLFGDLSKVVYMQNNILEVAI